MQNPFGPEQVPGSYFNLKARMFQKVQNAKINDHITEILQLAYEQALATENIALSRPERKRLFFQISKLVLEDMLKKFDSDTKST